MTIEAYAKLNLTLEVGGLRADGYHELKSVVLPISLSDTITVEADALGVYSSDTGYADDLCLKAAKALAAATDCGKGARIKVVKRIPSGGGLGGGSADAAAVLRALNELWGLSLSIPQLAEIGAKVGSDVPSLVLGGPVLMSGRGERVSSIGLKDKLDFGIVLIDPKIHSSTREVYAAYAGNPIAQSSATERMMDALKAGSLSAIGENLVNDLQAPACRLYPKIAEAMDDLRSLGARFVAMSGSGSCVFALVPRDFAAELSSKMSTRGFSAWSLIAVP